MGKNSLTIKQYRQLNGLSQKEMAKVLGVTQGTYNQKEMGKIKWSMQDIIDIKKHFKLTSFDDIGELDIHN